MTKHPEEEVEQATTETHVASWVQQHGKTVLYGIGIAVLAMLVIFRSAQSSNSQAQSDYVMAQHQVQQLAKTIDGGDAALDTLNDIIDRHDELRPKYEGEMAHYLLKQGKADSARPLLESSVARSQADNGALHLAYSQTSILIAEGKYQEALGQAEELQQAISDSGSSSYETLKFFNLLRIAILQQTLGNVDGERKAWEKLKLTASWMQEGPEGMPSKVAEIYHHFQAGNVGLMDYIQMRENRLAQ